MRSPNWPLAYLPPIGPSPMQPPRWAKLGADMAMALAPRTRAAIRSLLRFNMVFSLIITAGYSALEMIKAQTCKPAISAGERSVASCFRSDVRFDQSAVLFHPGPAAGGFAFAHQQGEGGVHAGDGLAVGLEGHEAAGVRTEGGFPKLVRVHFAETLEA